MDSISPNPWLLRQKADAIGSLKFPVILREMWSGGEVNDWIVEQWQRLIQVADLAERGE